MRNGKGEVVDKKPINQKRKNFASLLCKSYSFFTDRSRLLKVISKEYFRLMLALEVLFPISDI